MVRPRPRPRPRAEFRTLSASITALSLSFPPSLLLPLIPRRASILSTAMQRCIDEDDGQVGGGLAGDDGDCAGRELVSCIRCTYSARPRRRARHVGMRYFATPPRKRKYHVQVELQYDVYAHPAIMMTTSAAAVSSETVVSGTGSGSAYHAQILAASAPQLYVRRADKELEHLRALAMARARPCGCQCLCLCPRVCRCV